LLLYLAFRSLLDAVVVLSNVGFSAIGGFWALYLMDINFSVSAAVGFVSLFGRRHHGRPALDLVLQRRAFRAALPLRRFDHGKGSTRLAADADTDLTAILGPFPAACSTAIGSQTQRPLAIVVVGACSARCSDALLPDADLVQLLRPPRPADRAPLGCRIERAAIVERNVAPKGQRHESPGGNALVFAGDERSPEGARQAMAAILLRPSGQRRWFCVEPRALPWGFHVSAPSGRNQYPLPCRCEDHYPGCP